MLRYKYRSQRHWSGADGGWASGERSPGQDHQWKILYYSVPCRRNTAVNALGNELAYSLWHSVQVFCKVYIHICTYAMYGYGTPGILCTGSSNILVEEDFLTEKKKKMSISYHSPHVTHMKIEPPPLTRTLSPPRDKCPRTTSYRVFNASCITTNRCSFTLCVLLM